MSVEKSDIDQASDPRKAPSLFDYDIVISDVDAVLGEWQSCLPVESLRPTERNKCQWIETLNGKLSEDSSLLLSKGGLLVCLLEPVKGFSYTRRVHRRYGSGFEDRTFYVTNYGWIPINELRENAHWHIYYGSGKRIHLSDKPSTFHQYLKLPQTRWLAYFDDVESLEIEYRCIAVNDAGKPIALEVPIGKGWLVFLPVSDHAKFAEVILQCATRFMAQKRMRGRPPPSWMKDFRVPDEDEMNESLKKLTQQISELKVQLKKESLVKDRKTEIKKLLYEGDEPLENAVKKAFEEIEFSLTKKDDMDWISSSDTGEAILEVTGSEGSIDIDKLRQLLNYILSDYKATGKEKKAILVGNHFINDPPIKRGDPFTEKVVGESKVHFMCLLATVELYEALCAIREKTVTPETIRKKIMETVGICKLS